MKYIIFFLLFSCSLFGQSKEEPIVLETVKDVEKIQSANDWIVVTTTEKGLDHDPEKYIIEHDKIMKAIDRRLKAIEEKSKAKKEN